MMIVETLTAMVAEAEDGLYFDRWQNGQDEHICFCDRVCDGRCGDPLNGIVVRSTLRAPAAPVDECPF